MRIYSKGIIIFLLFFLCYLYPLYPEQTNTNIDTQKHFYITSELGAGHYIYAGAGYDLAKKLKLFQNHQYIKSIGILLGFTYLNENEDSVYIYEPGGFITGEIINKKIWLSKNSPLDIDWRIKVGKIYLNSKEYDIQADAITYGMDFLFRSFQYFFIDISLPFVSGDEGTELAPCVGMGIEYRLF